MILSQFKETSKLKLSDIWCFTLKIGDIPWKQKEIIEIDEFSMLVFSIAPYLKV